MDFTEPAISNQESRESPLITNSEVTAWIAEVVKQDYPDNIRESPFAVDGVDPETLLDNDLPLAA